MLCWIEGVLPLQYQQTHSYSLASIFSPLPIRAGSHNDPKFEQSSKFGIVWDPARNSISRLNIFSIGLGKVFCRTLILEHQRLRGLNEKNVWKIPCKQTSISGQAIVHSCCWLGLSSVDVQRSQNEVFLE